MNVKKNLLPVAIATAVAIIILAITYILNVSFLGAAWIIIGALLTVSITLVAILAGFVVVKSLFYIAAELSLLFFIAQAYCNAPAGLRSAASDDGLRSLVLLGLIYIAGAFVQSLYVAIMDRFKKIGASTRVSKLVHGDEAMPGWNFRKIVIVTVFIVFTIVFLWEIFLVVRPIVLGLCVY